AADPQLHALANVGGNFTANHNIGDSEAAARFENAKRLGEDAILVAGKINDAIRDDDVDGGVGQRDVFDRPFQKFHNCHAGIFLIFAGQRQHFVGHVETIGLTGGTNALRGENDVNSATGPEVEHDFAGL